MGGGGGGQPAAPSQPTTQTITTNPIADWAQPTANALIGTSMSNAFNMDPSGNILSSRGFTPFGGQTNAQGQFTGSPISQDQYNQQLQVAGLGVAGPSALQQQSYQGAANLQVPGQYNQASNMAGAAGIGALGTTGQAGMYGAQGDIAGQRAAGMSNMYGGMGAQSGQQAAGMSNLYGGLGAQSGQQYAGQSADAGQQGSDIGQQYAGQSGMYGGLGAMAGQQGANIGSSLAQQSQDPNAMQNYMNPYLQNSLAPALALQNQQFGQLGAQEQAQATQAGAFGGGREAVMAGLNQQNQMLAQNQLVGNAYNQAYNTAQGQMNTANQAALAGNQQALSGYGMGLQGAGQAGSQALSGNQQALSGYGQAGSQALAGYGMGLQGAGQAGSQSLAGYGMGLQGANQAGQLGIQGAQAGLQGVGAQQAGYGQAGQAGTNLANIGGQQLAAQQGVLSTQNAMGTQEQQNQQALLNQAIQNYGNQQNYGTTQATNIMNLLRSTPTTQTQTVYQAPPSTISQIGGLGATALGAYGASGGFKTNAAGGEIKEKKMASGGIASGVPAEKLPSMLEKLSDQQLAQKANLQTNDPQTAADAISQQSFRANARAGTPGFAPGGIVAFADGDLVEQMGKYETPDQPTLDKFYSRYGQGFDKIPPTSQVAPQTPDMMAIAQQNKDAGAAYLDAIKNARPDVAQQMWGRLMQFGANAAAGTSPNALTNFGAAAKETVPGLLEDTKANRLAQLEEAKAGYDISKMDSATLMEIAKNASQDREKELDRLKQQGMSETQANATITASLNALKGHQAQAAATGANTAELGKTRLLAEQNKALDRYQDNVLNVAKSLIPSNKSWDTATTAERKNAYNEATKMVEKPGSNNVIKLD